MQCVFTRSGVSRKKIIDKYTKEAELIQAELNYSGPTACLIARRQLWFPLSAGFQLGTASARLLKSRRPAKRAKNNRWPVKHVFSEMAFRGGGGFRACPGPSHHGVAGDPAEATDSDTSPGGRAYCPWSRPRTAQAVDDLSSYMQIKYGVRTSTGLLV